MRVAFSVQTPNSLRNFESVLRMLGDRGHETTILLHSAAPPEALDALLPTLLEEVPGLRCERAEHDLKRGRLKLGADVRSSIDLLRFLEPRFHETYRERSLRRAPRAMRRLAATPVLQVGWVRRAIGFVLAACERVLPVDRAVRDELAALRADVVLLTPYLGLRTVQPEVLRAARALGIPAAVCVASWDNLTSKSSLRPLPDRVFVWNETQRREAVELHGVPAGAVVVTGAQCFDHWFEWQPSPRAEFCERVGIDPEQPIVLYTCFTPFVRAANQDEAGFVERWLRALRTAQDPVLQNATVLVRPHPKRLEAWRDVDLADHGAVVWPREPPLPTDRSSKADYFDSLHHSAAVVGLNSTAMLEAGLVGRPVLTILVPEFWESQEGTLHFHYLLEVGGGLLRVTRSLDEHTTQLAEAVRGADEGAAERSRRFVEEFVRPHGRNRAATPLFVDAIEQLASRTAPATGASTL